MNEHAIREMLEGGGGAAGLTLRTLLYAPGKAYGFAMRLRRALYEKGTFASSAASLPVIAIGNVTAGGSGKTPLTALIANHILAKGKTPAILLRGYRAESGAGSDEATLYASLCPGAIVELGSDRSLSAKRAAEKGADVILMDDGFQHLRLKRDLDIVLIDASSPWGGGNTIPGGLLREPLSALSRAQVIVITRSDQVPSPALADIVNRIEKIAPGAALFTACHKPTRLRTAPGTPIPLERLRGQQVVILSGIARPEAFQKTLVSLGAQIADSFTGNDHRHFAKDFVAKALSRAEQLSAILVTTEKDEAKNLPLPADAPVWILGVEQDINNNDALFRIVDEITAN
jgi:tetraacyldisaccharide 4'-kinase